MKKRVVSLLLACVMLLGLLPAAALASSGENPTPSAAATSAKVNFTAQAAGAFLCAPQFDVEVSSREAENFGYTDSVTDGVSALDVLVKAHEVIYGENFTTNKKADYLEVGSSGFVSKLFGITTDASGFTLNGAYPNDGTPAAYGGGYNGTTVTTQAVVDNDNLEFFAYQDDKTYSDQLAWFSQNGLAVDTVTAKPSATVELVLKSNMYMMGYLYENADAMHTAGSAVEGAQLAWVNTATGKVTAIENAVTDETGKVSLTMPATEGTTYLTAYMPAANIEDGKSPLILSLTKVVADNNTVESDPCTLSSLVVKGYAATGYDQVELALTPTFSPETLTYTSAERVFRDDFTKNLLMVSLTAADNNATIKATLNGENEKDFSKQSTQSFNTMVPGQDNILTITVTKGSDSKTYTVTVPMAVDPTTAGTLELSGLHDAQVKSLKLYTYTGGTKGATDLLAGKTAEDSKYSLQLAAGDYWVEGYDENGDCNGGVKITVAAGETSAYKIQRIYQISTNSGWVKDTDYTLDVTITDADGKVRPSAPGQANSWGTVYPSCIFVVGDTVTATVTPNAEKYPNYNIAKVAKTPTMNDSISASCKEFVTVSFTAPEGSTITAGTLTNYYVFSYLEPYTAPSTANGKVSVTYHFDKGTDYFYRVQNPDGVTYWNYKKWNDGENIEITKADLYMDDASFNKDTVIHDFSKNIYDRADIYLNINAAGYKNMAVGESFELNSFRNWFAIESYMNARVALPDMHYQVISPDGSPSDVVTITPNANNSNVATMTANKAGTAIVLVTYDAMTNMAGMTTANTGTHQYSTIWPECTGVFVVTVGADGTGIQTNMQLDRMDAKITKDEQKTLDAEHDILFYLGDKGAEYTFKPEDGCTVTVARSTVSDKMTFSGFTSNGVAVAEDGTVTVSGLTTGRHIIKVEKNGVANYQVVTARQVSYKLVDADGKELTEEAKANIKAGDTVNIQFTGLLNPKEKLSGAYNFNFRLHYQGEDGTYFDSIPGGNFGVYDFSGNPARQKISITIPQYWEGSSYTLTGALKQGGFAGVPTHRGITYAKGTDRGFNAPSVSGILSRLPEITIDLAETEFITTKLQFQDKTGAALSREGLTITMKDAKGNVVTVGEDGSFKAVAGTYTYSIVNTADSTCTTGSFIVSAENKEFTITILDEQGISDREAAKAVIETIDAIGEVTLEKEQAIKDARAAYNALTDAQKKLVTNESTLTAAEAKLANLKNPGKPSKPDPDNKITVSFRLVGSTKATSEVELIKGEAGYNGAKYVTWIKTTSYTLDKDATVGDLFTLAMEQAKLDYVGLENNYISSITAPASCGGYALAEMTNGPNSGWMYTVNGSHPDRGLNDWTLFSGDTVVWHYVNDYAYEVADWVNDPSYPSLGDGSLHNQWLKAADVNPSSSGGSGGSSTTPDQTAANQVSSLISAIGTVTKDSGIKIQTARSAYDKLTDAQKKLVSNYKVLTEAEAAFAKLNTGLAFTDVKESDYFYDAVKWAVEKAITNGTSATTFGPEEGCTRSQMVTFLWRAAGSPEPTSKTNPFTDVTEDAYYYKALLWAIENGITKGTTDTTFSPDETCTRGQMATFLYRNAKSPAVTGSSAFTDVAADAYYSDAVAWTFQQGITKGATDTTYEPEASCTRGQMVTFLYRYLGK